MPKKKKTRKQKVLTDVRRQSDPKETQTAFVETQPQTKQENDAAPTVTFTQQAPRPAPYRNIITTDYQYLAGDLRKTLLLTGIILVLEIVLKFGTGI